MPVVAVWLAGLAFFLQRPLSRIRLVGGDREQIKKRKEILSKVKVLQATKDALELAEALIKSRAVPQKAAIDAAHIALASVHKMDYLLTWNCKHIANAEMVVKIESVCRKEGHNCPVICTPAELMGGK